jgi:hypothetical protein
MVDLVTPDFWFSLSRRMANNRQHYVKGTPFEPLAVGLNKLL